MKSDAQLKQDVESELAWEPAVDASHVGVAVENGIVALSGHLDSVEAKHAAERAVLRVPGVKGLAVALEVRLGPQARRDDAELAAAAEAALQWHVLVPPDRIRVMVEKGWVTLSGQVDWDYQRHAALKAIRALTGVAGITNDITVEARVTPSDVSARIEAALERQAVREARRIEVEVSGHTATLRGQVHSWAERVAAQGAAWSAPGITSVVNELKVV